MSGYEWHDAVGNLGVLLILVSYLLLQLGRLDPRQLPYSVYNALGAGLILLSLYFDFNLSAFLIEFFWIAISVLGIVLAWKKRPQQERP